MDNKLDKSLSYFLRIIIFDPTNCVMIILQSKEKLLGSTGVC